MRENGRAKVKMSGSKPMSELPWKWRTHELRGELDFRALLRFQTQDNDFHDRLKPSEHLIQMQDCA